MHLVDSLLVEAFADFVELAAPLAIVLFQELSLGFLSGRTLEHAPVDPKVYMSLVKFVSVLVHQPVSDGPLVAVVLVIKHCADLVAHLSVSPGNHLMYD